MTTNSEGHTEGPWTRLVCWWNGWRTDHDGWIVRARRQCDPETLPVEVGFVEESAIAVRSFADARSLDALATGAFDARG